MTTVPPEDDLLERIKLHAQQVFDYTFDDYLEDLLARYGADAITFHELKNGRIRGRVRLLNGRQRRVLADTYLAACQAVADILEEVVIAQSQGISVRTLRDWKRHTHAS